MSGKELSKASAGVIFTILVSCLFSCRSSRAVVESQRHTVSDFQRLDSSVIRAVLDRMTISSSEFYGQLVIDVSWVLAPDSTTPVPAKIKASYSGKRNSTESVRETSDSSGVAVSQTVSETTDSLKESGTVSTTTPGTGVSPLEKWGLISAVIVILIIAVLVYRIFKNPFKLLK